MSTNKPSKTLSLALGTAFAAGMAASNVATAAQNSNPFAMSELSSGYMQLADNHMEGKCGGKNPGEGRCGEGKKAEKEGKCGEGKCGEGKCGSKKEMKKNMEGKCGSGKAEKEGKCGEGKCGGNK